MAAEMSADLLAHWQAYFDAELPVGEITNWGQAQICSLLAEVNRDKSKRSEAFGPKDFLVRMVKSGDEAKAKQGMSLGERLTLWAKGTKRRG